MTRNLPPIALLGVARIEGFVARTCLRIGQTGGRQLVIEGHFELDLTVLRDEHEAVIPAAVADWARLQRESSSS